MPAFIDFPAGLDRAFGPAAPADPRDPLVATRHLLFTEPARAFSLGLATDTGEARSFDAFPHHEFFLVRQGSLTITAGGQSHVFGKGEAGVVPQGLACSWQGSADLLRVYGMSQSGAAGSSDTLVRIDPKGPLEPKGQPPAETTLTRPLPDISRRGDFSAEDGSLRAGVWATTAFRRMSFGRTDHEYMEIIEGQAEVDRAGTERTAYPAGSAFLAEDGADYALGSDVYFAKIFCVCSVG